MTRIKLPDSISSIVVKMCEGNPGALSVCAQMIKEGAEIDPGSFMGGMGAVLALDTIGVYGSHIWILFSDVCGRDLPKMAAVLRGWQLGFLSDVQVRRAVDGGPLDLDVVCDKVRERLPSFKFTVAAS